MQESRSPRVLIRLPCGLWRPVPVLLGPLGCLQHALQWPVEVEKSVTGVHQTPERLKIGKGRDSPGKSPGWVAARSRPGGWWRVGCPSYFHQPPLLCGAADLLSAGIVTLTVPGYLGTLHGTLPASAGLRRYGPSLVQGDAGGALIYQ